MEAIIASLLAPFLPHLLQAGQRIGAEAAEVLGSETGRLAERIWERLRDKVLSRPMAKGAAEDVAAAPDDERARGNLELQLEKLLQEDARLREELAALLEAGQRSGIVADRGGVVIAGGIHASDGGVAAGRDITGPVSTGDQRQQRR